MRSLVLMGLFLGGCAATAKTVAPEGPLEAADSVWISTADAAGLPPPAEPSKLPPPGPDWTEVALSGGEGGKRAQGDPQVLLPGDTVKKIARLEGRRLSVVVDIFVDETGKPQKTQVIDPQGAPDEVQNLYQRAIEAWRYEPFRVNGKAVPTVHRVEFRYSVG